MEGDHVAASGSTGSGLAQALLVATALRGQPLVLGGAVTVVAVTSTLRSAPQPQPPTSTATTTSTSPSTSTSAYWRGTCSDNYNDNVHDNDNENDMPATLCGG